MRFNPTLVRLRPISANLEASRRVCFNPTLVRLRHGTVTSDCARITRFNPTLVRLRHKSAYPITFVESAFQSHAGSIEAVATLWRRDSKC